MGCGCTLFLAHNPSYDAQRIITPHPVEAARLLGCEVEEVEQDRFAAIRQLQQRYGGVVVLKGAGTLVDDGKEIAVCLQGNPGMASGGWRCTYWHYCGAISAKNSLSGCGKTRGLATQ